MLHLLWSIIVGFLVGLIAGAIMHTHLGFIGTTLLGIVGSVVGGATILNSFAGAGSFAQGNVAFPPQFLPRPTLFSARTARQRPPDIRSAAPGWHATP